MTFRNVARADDTCVSTEVLILLRESKAHLNQKSLGAIDFHRPLAGLMMSAIT